MRRRLLSFYTSINISGACQIHITGQNCFLKLLNAMFFRCWQRVEVGCVADVSNERFLLPVKRLHLFVSECVAVIVTARAFALHAALF